MNCAERKHYAFIFLSFWCKTSSEVISARKTGISWSCICIMSILCGFCRSQRIALEFFCYICWVFHFLLLLYSLQVVSDSVTPWTAARQAPPSCTISQSLLKLMSIESVIPSNHLILCHPLLLPSIFPNIRADKQIKPRRVLECTNRKTRPLSSFPPPHCSY